MTVMDDDVEMEIFTSGAQRHASDEPGPEPPFLFEHDSAQVDFSFDQADDLAGEDLGVDVQDIWAGAVGGVPVHERSCIAPECVAGVRKTPTKTYHSMLRSLHRVDGKLLRDKLSHLAEGEYDLAGDVVRIRGPEAAQAAPKMAVDAEEGCVINRREAARTAKANIRRRADDSD
eukprot:TRINITY_DN61252_c0_g1_i1.p1 TRINITY_DN61252_c0_g1~~TRINITY_DN61252_c0_g1_i1.p1  ORF type:complete len:184 (+),score=41.64 TRINITY_DN61252_c0_g1_i1:31-552(+)